MDEITESVEVSKRAARRQATANKKAQRRFYYGRDLSKFPVAWGRAVATPSARANRATGNPRRYNKEKTIQEQREIQGGSLY